MNILNHPSVASEWLSGLDLDGKPHNVVITGVAEVEVPDRTGKATLCVAVAFRTPAGAPLRKRLILRPTHAKALAVVRAGDRQLDGQGHHDSPGECPGIRAGALRCARCGRSAGQDAAAGHSDRSGGGVTNQGGTPRSRPNRKD